jgi:uncharacterized repeat protein (TIGR03847 family)
MSVDLGMAQILGAEAVGLPGQRRFRLYVQGQAYSAAEGSAVMWMEKEQLNSLSLALDRALAQLTKGKIMRTEAVAAGRQVEPETMPPNFPRHPRHDFQVGQLLLAYDESGELFVLSGVPLEVMLERGTAQDVDTLMNAQETVLFRFTQQQAHRLSTTIAAIVRAGRPVCPLCGTPLDGRPHACVKQNGHYNILQSERGEETE